MYNEWNIHKYIKSAGLTLAKKSPVDAPPEGSTVLVRHTRHRDNRSGSPLRESQPKPTLCSVQKLPRYSRILPEDNNSRIPDRFLQSQPHCFCLLQQVNQLSQIHYSQITKWGIYGEMHYTRATWIFGACYLATCKEGTGVKSTVSSMKPWYYVITLFLPFTTASNILKAKLQESATGNPRSKRIEQRMMRGEMKKGDMRGS